MTPDEAALARRRLRRRIGRVLRHSASLVRSIAGLTVEGTRMVGREGVQFWRGRRAAKLLALDRLNRIPLRSLYADFPEARSYVRREVGLRSIPLDEIAGTAVAGPAQRGSDFTPMPAFRSQNWEARWHRLSRATNDLAILPPIDVLRFGDRYWVEDGHNRVAAALRNGQVEIDAAVTDLRSPAATSTQRATTMLAPMLEEGRELRAAGEGRFSAQAASLLASTADEADHSHAHAHAGEDDGAGRALARGGDAADAGRGEAAPEDAAPKARRRISRMPRPASATAVAAAAAAAASAAAAATEASAREVVEELRPRRRGRRSGSTPEQAVGPAAGGSDAGDGLPDDTDASALTPGLAPADPAMTPT